MGPNTWQEALELAKQEGAAATRERQAGNLERAVVHMEAALNWHLAAIQMVAEAAGMPQDVDLHAQEQGSWPQA